MSQRNKNILLVLGFLAVLYLCYTVSIKKTLALKTEINSLNDSISRYETLSNQAQNLKAKEVYIDSVLASNNFNNVSIQNNILNVLNAQAEEKGFLISEFNEPHTFSENGISINSYPFRLTGDFNDLLDVIYFFEQNTRLGKVAHVNFEKKKDYRKRKDYLECFVVIESLISE